jgi:hypothetical protein
MAQQNPKRPSAKNKRHKLTISHKDKWKQILREVEKLEAPVSVVQTISVNLVDGTIVEIDVEQLLLEGMSETDLEREINEKLHDLDNIISNVDFFINIDHVAKTVQPITDSLLKNL